MIKIIKSDILRLGKKASVFNFLKLYFKNSGFRAVFLFRLMDWLYGYNIKIIPTMISNYSISKTGCEILPGAEIGPGLRIIHSVGIVIGNGVVCGQNFTILQNVTIGEKYSKINGHSYPKIGNNVTICAGAVVLGGIKIGDNSVIGANAVVLSDVEGDMVVAGIPAKEVRKGVSI